MIVSTIVSAIAFTTVVVVAVIVAYQTSNYKNENDQRLRNIVDQVNTSQQYGYEFDKRQQQDLAGMQKNIDDVRVKYITKADTAKSIDTEQLNAKAASFSNLTLKGNTTYNSEITGASASSLYNIQRGNTEGTKNHLMFQTPIEPTAGFNFANSGGISRMYIDSTTGVVKIPQRLEVANRLTIGEKSYLSENGGRLVVDTPNGLLANDFKVNGDFSVSGKTTYDGDILANGKMYLNDTNIKGSLNIGNDTQFNPANKSNKITGDTSIYGETSAYGAFSMDGDLRVNKTLNVNNNANIAGTFTVSGPNPQRPTKFNTLDKKNEVVGDTTVFGRFTNQGPAFVYGDQYVANNLKVDGRVEIPNTINVLRGDPGPMIQKSYGNDGDRYGVGQFPGGQMRMYTATAYPQASLALSYAKPDGNFDDVLLVNPDRSVNVAGNLKVSGQTCVNTTCLNEDDFKKLKDIISKN